MTAPIDLDALDELRRAAELRDVKLDECGHLVGDDGLPYQRGYSNEVQLCENEKAAPYFLALVNAHEQVAREIRRLREGAEAAAIANAYFRAAARVEQLSGNDIDSLLAECEGKPTLREENETLRAQLATIRRETREECARVCDGPCQECAAAIRALGDGT